MKMPQNVVDQTAKGDGTISSAYVTMPSAPA